MVQTNVGRRCKHAPGSAAAKDWCRCQKQSRDHLAADQVVDSFHQSGVQPMAGILAGLLRESRAMGRVVVLSVHAFLLQRAARAAPPTQQLPGSRRIGGHISR